MHYPLYGFWSMLTGVEIFSDVQECMRFKHGFRSGEGRWKRSVCEAELDDERLEEGEAANGCGVG